MGEVYRARDTDLGRDVAVKVLPRTHSAWLFDRTGVRGRSDDDRLARFRREAQVLASLNHPNIAAIHGLEESDGVYALVLELVAGPTLADRIAEGPIPVDDALPIARQIAEALEAAHERGIVHRDLKPANIKLRPDGTVKLLDFGLAKILQQDMTVDGDTTASSTLTSPSLVRRGVILGTAAYASPEQARGQEADQRSDIWAFGAVLYEMLSGRRAFPGDDVSDTIAAVLHLPIDVVRSRSIDAGIRSAIALALPRARRPAETARYRRGAHRIGRSNRCRSGGRVGIRSRPVGPAATVAPSLDANGGRHRGCGGGRRGRLDRHTSERPSGVAIRRFDNGDQCAIGGSPVARPDHHGEWHTHRVQGWNSVAPARSCSCVDSISSSRRH